MLLKDKIRGAILKGINEAFDIDDLGNEIEDKPVTKKSVSKHSKIYLGLDDKASECKKRGIVLDFIDNNGKVIKNTEDVPNIRFVRFGADELMENGTDNRIVISVRWKEHFDRINHPYGNNWQTTYAKILSLDDYQDFRTHEERYEHAIEDFNGYQNTKMAISDIPEMIDIYDRFIDIPAITKTNKAKEVLNGKDVYAYLPSLGQLKFIFDNLDLINGVLDVISVDLIDLHNEFWWSSTEYGA